MSSGGGLAEKFQITAPYHEEGATAEDQWASFQSQRCVGDNVKPEITNKFNRLSLTDVMVNERRSEFDFGTGGDKDESGTRLFSDPKFFTQGYKRLEMKSTDDQYSGEHIDLFYGEAVDEKGNIGFSERNNYLDRL